MKNLILALFVLASLNLVAQTNGISYQAVIVGPDNQELPGVDAEGNILPNATIAIRFTILDANNIAEYQEVQTTNTDQYGRINLLIGQMDPDGFAKISWDGTNKDLKVEIDFSGGSNFVDMAREKLTFLPYAYHRNITATGTLTVDDLTFLNGELQVDGPTNLNSTLNVNGGNATNLSGDLTVLGDTNLKTLVIDGDLDVSGVTVLRDSLNVINQASTNLSGVLNVDDLATFNNGISVVGESKFYDLFVENTSHLSNGVNIFGQTVLNVSSTDSTMMLTQNKIYPLVVKGQNQGIAIMVSGIPNNYSNSYRDIHVSNENIFISFLDQDSGISYGRIKGNSIVDLHNNPKYIYDVAKGTTKLVILGTKTLIKVLEATFGSAEIAFALSSSTACVGVGACITVPIPSLIASKIVKTIIKIGHVVIVIADGLLTIAQVADFIILAEGNIGVSYSSGAADYAEWLPKQKITDQFRQGDIVGVKNGEVTKNTWGAEKIMIVSSNPIVIGNMPLNNNEENNVMIAFMGQVPVKVLGEVSPGDYILPNILGDGFARAVHPDKMKIRDYKLIAGVAWSVIKEITDGASLVNVAVGINTNDLSNEVANQQEELSTLRKEILRLEIQMDQSNNTLAKLLPGYAAAIGMHFLING